MQFTSVCGVLGQESRFSSFEGAELQQYTKSTPCGNKFSCKFSGLLVVGPVSNEDL
jgi:hypothetical protein